MLTSCGGDSDISVVGETGSDVALKQGAAGPGAGRNLGGPMNRPGVR